MYEFRCSGIQYKIKGNGFSKDRLLQTKPILLETLSYHTLQRTFQNERPCDPLSLLHDEILVHFDLNIGTGFARGALICQNRSHVDE